MCRKSFLIYIIIVLVMMFAGCSATEKHDIEIMDYCVSQEKNEIIITVEQSDYLSTLWTTYDVPVSFQVQ